LVVVVNLSGRLSVVDNSAGTGEGAAISRRTMTGTVYRVELGGGITAWLDGDHQHGTGELNRVATQMCAVLSGGGFTDPSGAPFVCGPVLFAGTDTAGPVGLRDAQLRRVADAHAASVEDIDVVPAEAADLVPVLA